MLNKGEIRIESADVTEIKEECRQRIRTSLKSNSVRCNSSKIMCDATAEQLKRYRKEYVSEIG